MKRTILLALSLLTIVFSLFALSSCKKEEKFDVIFMVEGQQYSKITSSGNRLFPLPPEPQKEGYTFEGWYYDEDYYLYPFDNAAWENAPLVSNVTVYAKWKIVGACPVCTPGAFTVIEEPTCTEEGVEEATCTECFEKVYRAIPMVAHTPSEEKVIDNEVASTCSKEGSFDEVTVCADCGAELAREEKTVEKTAHTPDDALWEKIVDSTCTVEGSYESVVYCFDCRAELSREKCTIACKPHDADHNVCSMCKGDFLTYEYSEALNGYIVTGAMQNTYSTIVIPSKYEGKAVRAIGAGAFKDFMNLKKIEIPFNVTSIGENAFSGCSALANITYHGKLKEWELITIAQGNEPLDAITPYCTNNFTDWMPF